MIAKPKLVATLVMGAAMVFTANAIQAADCSEVASKVGKLYAAKASKDNAAYSTIKTGLLGDASHKDIYSMLVRAVDDNMYGSPEAMEKAAVRYCTRKMASN